MLGAMEFGGLPHFISIQNQPEKSPVSNSVGARSGRAAGEARQVWFLQGLLRGSLKSVDGVARIILYSETVNRPKMGKKPWSSQEIMLLESLEEAALKKNWKAISKLLASKGYDRSEQECRHKWVNCLSPEINHGPWRDEELSILYNEYEKKLSWWSAIQKLLPDRTQIKIKNHFYGVLRGIVRCVLKYFGKVAGRESEISNRINPNSLKCVFWGEDNYQFLGHEVKNLITAMHYRFNKQKVCQVISAAPKIYETLNDKILEEVHVQVSPELHRKEESLYSDVPDDVEQPCGVGICTDVFQQPIPANFYTVWHPAPYLDAPMPMLCFMEGGFTLDNRFLYNSCL